MINIKSLFGYENNNNLNIIILFTLLQGNTFSVSEGDDIIESQYNIKGWHFYIFLINSGRA